MLSRIKHLKVFFRDPNKKNFFKMAKEIIHYGWVKKEMPTDYFRKFLYRKEAKDYLSYLSLNQFFKIISSPKIVTPEISNQLKDKLLFSKLCNEYNLPTPKLFSYNYKNKFYIDDNEFIINNKQQLFSFFENLFLENNLEHLFLKPIDGIGGKGCYLVEKKKIKQQIEDIYDKLLKNNYIHQDNIKQHLSIDKIHSKSINTIRMDTYIDKNNNIHVLSAIMRFGIGKNVTDNISAGGFFISLNLDKGKLEGLGRQEIICGGNTYTQHPDSKIELNDYTIPYVKEACLLAKKANSYFKNRVVGWDIAITPDGPIIIEGNHNPSLHTTDVAYGGYCKHPKIKELLMELNL